MTDKALRPILEYVRRAQSVRKEPAFLGTVTNVTASGVEVQFDGDPSATTKKYKAVVGCDIGDRVVLVRVGLGLVVIGALRTGPVIQAANTVLTTSGAGIGTVTFSSPYPVAPVVQVTCYDILHVARQVVPTTLGFTFTAYNAAGATLNTTAVRIGWSAHPAT